eukprot:4202400-Alexandrium_andersonii.AAC.1
MVVNHMPQVPLTVILTSQGAQSAIRNPPTTRRYCNPPQSAIRHAQNAKSLQAFEPESARSQERLRIGPPKLPR